MYQERIDKLRSRLAQADIALALITDEDSVYYFTGYYDYLHMEFGRPTLLLVPQQADTLLITPGIDYNMALQAAAVDRIESWNDGLGREWRETLPAMLVDRHAIALEMGSMPALVRSYIDSLVEQQRIHDITPMIDEMRMVKSAAELQMARHAGQVADAMMTAGRLSIAAGVAEYEVALATAAAGTRTAARLLQEHYQGSRISPNIHFLQIMASGSEITLTHHRASTRVMRQGDPVFLCFCGMTNFHRFKLGFDRTFWIEEITDPAQAKIYDIALRSQAAALRQLRPGVTAESVHQAYAEVIQQAGYEYPFRCGRGTGFSYLERPQLVSGDQTLLQVGMVLAVDGSVSSGNFRAQVGDSFILTEDGYECITTHPKSIEEVIIH